MNANKEDKLKHLEFVQAIIARQAQNSFIVKGWLITVITIVFAITEAENSSPYAFLIAIVPTAVFWYMDALYHQQERKFRKLHEAISKDICDGTNEVELFRIDMNDHSNDVASLLRTAFSRTNLPIPATSIVVTVLLVVANAVS